MNKKIQEYLESLPNDIISKPDISYCPDCHQESLIEYEYLDDNSIIIYCPLCKYEDNMLNNFDLPALLGLD